jgi:SSS family solute:Na+ symporter
MPAFFGSRYQSKGLKVGASAIIFIFLIPYTASLYNGLSRLFAMAFDVDFTVCIAVMAVLTGVYVIAGGYVATAVNDFIQGVIMLIGIIVVIAAVLNTNGGFTSSLDLLSRVAGEGENPAPGVFASFFGPDPVSLLGVVILTSLGTWGLPQMVQKFYSIQSEKAVDKGTLISTLFALVISGGCYFLGGFGRLFSAKIDIAANGFDSVIPTMLSGFSDVLIGVILMLVLSASMSTLSSLVMASASTFTLDFLRGNIIKKMTDKSQLRVIRGLIVVFIAISSVIAIVQYRQNVTFIAQLMGISWGALAGAFLAPFMYGLYWKRATKAAVWVNFIYAATFMTLNMLVKPMFPVILQSPINAGAFVMLSGLVIVPVISAFTAAPEKLFVEETFAHYNDMVTVRATEALGETVEERV